MSNFLEYIKSDIEAKKTLLSSMPTNNKTNQKLYNEKILGIEKSYKKYKEGVLKYIYAKSESFNCAKEEHNTEEIKEQLEEYKHIKYILNPMNSFMEKMGLDDLLYDIHNYSNFTFDEMNEIIRKLIEKFKQAGVTLKSEDFRYTYYVHEYMKEYLVCEKDYSKLNSTFEQIYWYNPEIIEDIEINFRKLIKKYQKEFEEYIEKEQKNLLGKNKFKSYDEFRKALRDKYEEYVRSSEEDIGEIIEKAKKGDIDISNYLPDSKFRTTAYETLTISEIDYENEEAVEKLLNTLRSLRRNIVEYSNYLKYTPLFDYFREKYEKEESGKGNEGALKEIDNQIKTKETKLESINSKIFGKGGLFAKKASKEEIKDLKIESIKIAKELYELYYKKDGIKFENKVISIKKDSLLVISDVVRLYWSYNFLKKETLKNVFGLESYQEVIDMSKEFDEFASNPTNVIINGINTFEKPDVASIIANKYRLENINVEVADLDEDSIDVLKNKIDFIFRIQKIEKSKIDEKKISFMVEVEKIKEKEAKEEAKE